MHAITRGPNAARPFAGPAIISPSRPIGPTGGAVCLPSRPSGVQGLPGRSERPGRSPFNAGIPHVGQRGYLSLDHSRHDRRDRDRDCNDRDRRGGSVRFGFGFGISSSHRSCPPSRYPVGVYPGFGFYSSPVIRETVVVEQPVIVDGYGSPDTYPTYPQTDYAPASPIDSTPYLDDATRQALQLPDHIADQPAALPDGYETGTEDEDLQLPADDEGGAVEPLLTPDQNTWEGSGIDPTSGPGDWDRLGALMEQGTQAFGQRQYANAASAFQQVAHANPENVDALLAYAVARFATADYADAADAIRRAVRAYPAVAQADFNLLDRYADPSDFDRHLAALLGHLRSHADDGDGLLVLAFVHHFTGQRELAAGLFDRLSTRVPSDADLAQAFRAQ